MIRELDVIGYMGPGGYARVVRRGATFRVYAGRTPDAATLRADCTHEEDAHTLARKSAFATPRARVQTLAYAEAVRS